MRALGDTKNAERNVPSFGGRSFSSGLNSFETKLEIHTFIYLLDLHPWCPPGRKRASLAKDNFLFPPCFSFTARKNASLSDSALPFTPYSPRKVEEGGKRQVD